MTKKIHKICNICGKNQIKELYSLDNYPATALYIEDYKDEKNAGNFSLDYCENCCHLQGVSTFSLDHFYNENYSYDATNNNNIQYRHSFVTERIAQYCKGKKFNRLIDIGCNDLSLLKRLKAIGINAEHFIGIDPIPINETDLIDGIEFINGYVQDIEIPYADNNLVDLIVSVETFEHIPEVNLMFEVLAEKLSPNSTFIVCVPSLDLLIENFTFPSISHEHVNYFSEYSLAKLFNDCSFKLEFSELIDVTWGFLFQIHTKVDYRTTLSIAPPVQLLSKFERNYQFFLKNLKCVLEIIKSTEGKIFGFGASDLTANFAYFLDSDLSELTYIIDDTPYKQNMYILGLKPKIVNLGNVGDLSDATIVITAPHASRAIIKRLLELNPKKIINPLNIF
jgi:hypothetical protein